MSRRAKKSSWTADVKIGRSPKLGEPPYDLDHFTDAGIQAWDAYARAVRDFQRKVGISPADGYAGLKVLARLRQSS